MASVMEYYGKIKNRCIAKPETDEERTKRRAAEIEVLKLALATALAILRPPRTRM